MKGSKMFSFITKTWNPIVMDCDHQCCYCWAIALKKGRLKDSPRYKDLTFLQPKLIEKELHRMFFEGDYVFVEGMGDLFAASVPEPFIYEVMKVIEKCYDAKFLLLTKNPYRMLEYKFPENVLCGCTIETTRTVRAFSKAPAPSNRYWAMRKLNHSHKAIIIEPIMNFSPAQFLCWIQEIKPELVVIGYDNYANHLPEPSLKKTQAFIKALQDLKLNVQTKTLREKWNGDK